MSSAVRTPANINRSIGGFIKKKFDESACWRWTLRLSAGAALLFTLTMAIMEAVSISKLRSQGLDGKTAGYISLVNTWLAGLVLYWLIPLPLHVIPVVIWYKGMEAEKKLYSNSLYADVLIVFGDLLLDIMTVSQVILTEDCPDGVCIAHFSIRDLEPVIYYGTLLISVIGAAYSGISLWIYLFQIICNRTYHYSLYNGLSCAVKVLLVITSSVTFTVSMILASHDYPSVDYFLLSIYWKNHSTAADVVILSLVAFAIILSTTIIPVGLFYCVKKFRERGEYQTPGKETDEGGVEDGPGNDENVNSAESKIIVGDQHTEHTGEYTEPDKTTKC